MNAFVRLLGDYGFSYLYWIAPVLALLEAAIGVCLLLNIYPKIASLFSIITIAVFSCAFLYAFLLKDIADCGCFGKIEMLKTSPLWTFVRNISLLILGFISWWFSTKDTAGSHLKFSMLVLLLFVVCFFSGYSFSPQQKTKRHPLFEAPVKTTILPELMSVSTDSTYMVFIFSYRCQSCWNYFENVARYKSSDVVDKIAVFAGGIDEDNAFKNYFTPDFEIQGVDEAELLKLTQVSPTMLYIKNDTIKYVIQGVILTPYLFRINYLETN